MQEHEENHTPELTQDQLTELERMAEKALQLPSVIRSSDNAVWLSVPRRDDKEDQPAASLALTRNPPEDPTAFLSLKYLDNTFGPDPTETETLYVMSRDLDGKLTLKVSDRVSTRDTTNLIHEAADFTKVTTDHPDTEMVEAAVAGLRNEVRDALAIESLELSTTLKAASQKDYEELRDSLEAI